MRNKFNPLSNGFDLIITKSSEIKTSSGLTMQEVLDNIGSLFQFIGEINIASDFPLTADVKNGWTYKITTDVIDNDPTKTNTLQSFRIGDVISWNGTDWTDISGIEVFIEEATQIKAINDKPLNLQTSGLKDSNVITAVKLGDVANISLNTTNKTILGSINENKLGIDNLLTNKLNKNTDITGATKTKITYDSKGLITAGDVLAEADIPTLSISKITNLQTNLDGKQATLVSGTNIKTINGNSLLGSGDITISSGSSGEAVKITSQTIDIGVANKDPVYFDKTISKWKKATSQTTSPTGIYLGTAGEVVLFGKTTTSGLTAGEFYYLQDGGGIGIVVGTTKIKIGYAISPTELLIDIDTNTDGGVVIGVIGRGYAIGGHNGSGYSTEIDGIQFSNETAINPSATLAVARQGPAGTNSNTKGYAMGGNALSYLTEIDGIQFDNETAINPSAVLSVARSYLAGTNSTTKGYAMGGSNGSNSNEIDGIQFDNETAINPSATLSVVRWGPAGTNSTTKGYTMGGYGGNYSNEIDGIQFDNETAINPSATLSVARYLLAGTNSTTKGYAMGGYKSSGNSTEIDGIQFSTETAINPSATLAVERNRLTGTNSTTKGYTMGGYGGSYTNEIDGIQFDNEAAINPSATLSVARQRPAGVQSGGIL